jgi:DNA-binding GntR family transcriptional regulator
LTLRFLAESFGVSITPVRDAVTRLVAQEVLQLGPRNSAIVPQLTAGELKHLTVVRCALEGRAAREAANNPDQKARARLEARLATMRSLIRDRKLESYLDHHRTFHFEIYAMSEIPGALMSRTLRLSQTSQRRQTIWGNWRIRRDAWPNRYGDENSILRKSAARSKRI